MCKKKIRADTTLEEVLKRKKIKVLEKFNLPCLKCPMLQFELKKLKLGELAKTYGLDLKAMLKELNKKC